MLNVENLSFGIEGKTLLYATSINFERGLFHVIMGANGAGKSTLLKLLAGDLQPLSGSVLLQGRPLTAYTKKELAQSRAVLSQQYHLAFPVSVQEVVLMGRYPYFGAAPTATDKAICNMAMAQMDVLHLAGRDYGTLSGGEAQKVQMSRVLAQIGDKDFEAKLLLLDEPVSHLDVKYQHQLLKAAKNLCNRGVTVVAVLHDINLAITYASRVLFMKEGRMVHDLADTRSISTDIIQAVFDVSATILLQNGQKPVVVF